MDKERETKIQLATLDSLNQDIWDVHWSLDNELGDVMLYDEPLDEEKWKQALDLLIDARRLISEAKDIVKSGFNPTNFEELLKE